MKNIKRVIAIICVAALLLLYVITFILALSDNPHTITMFKGCFICTIFIPIVAYIFIRLHAYAMWRSGRSDSYSEPSSKPSSASCSDNDGSGGVQ